jgi:hypothetical protein
MNFWMTKIVLPLLIITLNVSCSGPSLEEFLHKNQEEKKIISLLIQYPDAKSTVALINFWPVYTKRDIFISDEDLCCL